MCGRKGHQRKLANFQCAAGPLSLIEPAVGWKDCSPLSTLRVMRPKVVDRKHNELTNVFDRAVWILNESRVSSNEPNGCCGEVNSGEEVPRRFVVSGCDGAEKFEFGEEVLDQMTCFVEVLICSRAALFDLPWAG